MDGWIDVHNIHVTVGRERARTATSEDNGHGMRKQFYEDDDDQFHFACMQSINHKSERWRWWEFQSTKSA
jgi:hypothetical protein